MSAALNLPKRQGADEMVWTFSMGGETRAAPVVHVMQIIDPQPPAHPAPGVTNVRGVTSPFVDLRQRLRRKPALIGESSRVIVLDFTARGEATKIAMLADDVDHITGTPQADIKTVPESGGRWPVHLIRKSQRRTARSSMSPTWRTPSRRHHPFNPRPEERPRSCV